uniref:Vesicle transport v-SNARE N-terminal domain-containing protein n=1 Tax=Parascaris equorum TaxID=6256 RepID=A0A914RVV6_PAREQ
TAEITSRIGGLANLEKHERLGGIQHVQRLLVDVESLLEQMELTVRELDPASSERSKYDLRVRSYRNDKKQLDGELDKAIQRLKENAGREELMAFDNEISLDQIGAEVLGDLSSQRETISRARDRLREADSDLNRSRKVLSQMIRRFRENLKLRF